MVVLDACFWVVCLVLVASGATKLVDPAPFDRALAQLGVGRSGPTAARTVGALEVVLGLAGLAVGGRAVAAVVTVAYVGFALVAWRARQLGLSSCGCFGEHSGPPSGAHALLNVASAVLAGAGVVRPPVAVADALAGRSWSALAILALVLVAACAVVVLDTRAPGATVRPTTSIQGD